MLCVSRDMLQALAKIRLSCGYLHSNSSIRCVGSSDLVSLLGQSSPPVFFPFIPPLLSITLPAKLWPSIYCCVLLSLHILCAIISVHTFICMTEQESREITRSEILRGEYILSGFRLSWQHLDIGAVHPLIRVAQVVTNKQTTSVVPFESWRKVRVPQPIARPEQILKAKGVRPKYQLKTAKSHEDTFFPLSSLWFSLASVHG